MVYGHLCKACLLHYILKTSLSVRAKHSAKWLSYACLGLAGSVADFSVVRDSSATVAISERCKSNMANEQILGQQTAQHS